MYAVVALNQDMNPICIHLFRGDNLDTRAKVKYEYHRPVTNCVLKIIYIIKESRYRSLTQEYLSTRRHEWESTISVQHRQVQIHGEKVTECFI